MSNPSNKNNFLLNLLDFSRQLYFVKLFHMIILHGYLLVIYHIFCIILLTSRSLFPKPIPRLGIALRMATKDCIVLLYTTGRYCLKSSDVNPLSWIILKKIRGSCELVFSTCQLLNYMMSLVKRTYSSSLHNALMII